LLSKFSLYSRKLASGLETIGEGFYLIYRHGLYKDPNNPVNTRYVQYFCRRLCEVFNIEVQVHGTIPREPALWVSNHISWLDVAVLGSGARIFFLAKAEVEKWPILGNLAKGGGTLFIKRGSGDSLRIKEQITEFLKKDIPVLFFPEATTTDGRKVKKVCVICYVNQQGELDMIAPFIGEMSFAEHVQRVLEMPQVTAHLLTLPAIPVTGHTVDTLTKEVDQKMREGLAELHRKVLKVMPDSDVT
jgi:1-acyl-sn-glycerol-3-phosphate acyltransferase